MRRSEMIANIESVIDKHIELSFEYREGLAEDILETIMKEGMIPPTLELSASGERMSTEDFLGYSEIDYSTDWEVEIEDSEDY